MSGDFVQLAPRRWGFEPAKKGVIPPRFDGSDILLKINSTGIATNLSYWVEIPCRLDILCYSKLVNAALPKPLRADSDAAA